MTITSEPAFIAGFLFCFTVDLISTSNDNYYIERANGDVMKDLIIDVLEMLDRGLTVQQVADRFGLSISDVEGIVSKFGDDFGYGG